MKTSIVKRVLSIGRGDPTCQCGHPKSRHEWTEYMHSDSRILDFVDLCLDCRNAYDDDIPDCFEFRGAS